MTVNEKDLIRRFFYTFPLIFLSFFIIRDTEINSYIAATVILGFYIIYRGVHNKYTRLLLYFGISISLFNILCYISAKLNLITSSYAILKDYFILISIFITIIFLLDFASFFSKRLMNKELWEHWFFTPSVSLAIGHWGIKYSIGTILWKHQAKP